MTTAELKNIVKTIPSKPGVYLFKNKAGVNVYVGKAAALKARLGSYLNPPAGGRDPRLPKKNCPPHKNEYKQNKKKK